MKINIDVELSAAFKRNLKPPYVFGDPLRDFLTDVGEYTNNEAKRLAPAGVSGRLRESHTFEVDSGSSPLWAEVRPESPYAAAVHEGSRPHWAPISALRPWAEMKGINPYAVQRSIAKKGTKPHPWLPAAARLGQIYILRRGAAFVQRVKQHWDRR